MNQVKLLKSFLGVLTIGMALLFFQACTDVDCENVDCGPGDCNTGVCECPLGYSGSFCETYDACVALSVECLGNASCDGEDGECYCDPGYEPDAEGVCNTEIRGKYLGPYNGLDNCTETGETSYQSTVDSNPNDVTEMIFTNFGAYDVNVVATVTNINTFVIQSQQIGDFIFEGLEDGTYDPVTGEVRIQYRFTLDEGLGENNAFEDCTMVLAPQ